MPSNFAFSVCILTHLLFSTHHSYIRSPDPTFLFSLCFCVNSTMKLFNWIHRKSSQKDESSENVKRDGDFANVPKENETFGDNYVFDDWKGGILTIGTFGYHQLEDIEIEQKSSDDYFSFENDESDQMTDDDDEEENEEINHPLLEMKNGDSDHNSLEDDSDEIKKERTTLADLFYADSVKLDEKHPEEKGLVIKEKMNMNKKHCLSFSKKKLVQEEASRPIKKLNRLMRRMLKRKIHPDLGLNKDGLNDDKVRPNICGVNEATSLLIPSQDATI